MIELINSSDGKIRGARVQVGATGSILQRPVQALYPLEISSSQIDSPIVQQEHMSVSTEDNTMITRRDRPQRAAAVTSQQIWRALETNND